MIAIYARISKDEQSKYSISDQIRECRKRAGKTDEIMEYIDEGVSGEYLERPGLNRLRQDIKEGLITKVVIYDPDRWSRNLMNQLIVTNEIEKSGVELVFVNHEYRKTPEGQLFYSMRGAISEYERAKINERMSRGRREKARQGRVLRDFHVYGYDFDKENEKMVINENEAQVVRLIFDLFIHPNGLVKGINGIAHYLTEKKIPTKRGANVWHRQVVRQLLMNRAYIGEFYQNRWNTEGMLGNKLKRPDERISMKERPREEWIQIPCPAFIDEGTFNHAQKLIRESRRRWSKKSQHQYLLSGLVRCGDCGNTMTGRRAKNWGKYVFEYTDIKNYSGARFPGCGRKIKTEDLDREVWDSVIKWLNHPDEIATANETVQNKKEPSLEEMEINRLEEEIEKARSGRKRLLKLFAEGMDISEDEVRQSLHDLKKKENELTERINKLEESVKETENLQYSQNVLKEAADYYLNRGEGDLTFEDKQEIIRHVVREIQVFEDDIKIFTF